MWNYSLAYLQEKLTIGYLRQTDLTPQNCPEFMDLVATLGNKTEEMSNCLSQPDSNPAFSPVPVDDKFIRNYQKNLTVLLYQSHRNIEQNIDNLPKDTKIKAQKLLSNWDSLTKSFINKQITRLNSGKDRGYTCRVHGDFHLGQVMVTKDNDLRFIDFAGEPGLPIEQRKEKHIYIELNGRRILFTPKEIQDMVDTGVKFIVDSDAHHPLDVGRNHRGINVIEKYNIPISQVANIDKLPDFTEKTY